MNSATETVWKRARSIEPEEKLRDDVMFLINKQKSRKELPKPNQVSKTVPAMDILVLPGMKKNENKIERYVNSYSRRRSPVERLSGKNIIEESNRPRFNPLPPTESWRALSKTQRESEITGMNQDYKLFKQLHPKQILTIQNRIDDVLHTKYVSTTREKKFSLPFKNRLFPRSGSHSSQSSHQRFSDGGLVAERNGRSPEDYSEDDIIKGHNKIREEYEDGYFLTSTNQGVELLNQENAETIENTENIHTIFGARLRKNMDPKLAEKVRKAILDEIIKGKVLRDPVEFMNLITEKMIPEEVEKFRKIKNAEDQIIYKEKVISKKPHRNVEFLIKALPKSSQEKVRSKITKNLKHV